MRAAKILAAVTAIGVSFTSISSASADQVVNNIDATIDSDLEVKDVTVGGTAEVVIRVVTQDDDGQRNCNLSGTTSKTFSVVSSNAAWATVSPATVTFNNCGQDRTLTVTGVAAGTATISLSHTNTAGAHTWDSAPATFQARVGQAAATCTTTAPAAPTVTRSDLAASGWYNGNSGAASFTVIPASNAEYSLNGGTTWQAYSTTVTVSPAASATTDGTHSAIARNFVPEAGNCARVSGTSSSAASLPVDRTAPSYGIVVSPDANLAGWNRDTVTVDYTCSDAGSGFVAGACPTDATLGHGTDLPQATSTVTDVAGNTSALATRRAIMVDTVAPTVTATVPAAYNAEGWNQPFSLTYSCADLNADGVTTGSGLPTSGVGGCPAAENFTQSGSPYAERGVTVTDVAGNASAIFARRLIKIDATRPSAQVVVSPNQNDQGWNRTTTTADYTCSDTNGLAIDCPADETFTTDSDNPAADFSATDNAGNTSLPATRREVKLDTNAPSVTVALRNAAGQVLTPTNGYFRQDVTVDFACTDVAVNGIASGVRSTGAYACPADYTVSTEGTTPAVSYPARDNADNESSADVSAIMIDTVAPTASVLVSPDANVDGWNNTAVSVDWSCADNDGGSGLDPLTPCPADRTGANTFGDGSDVAAQTATVKDRAGNESTPAATARAIKVDTQLPTVTVALADLAGNPIAANDNGWFNQTVVVDFTCSDNTGGSGLRASNQPYACPPGYQLGEGAHDAGPYDVRDVADNSRTGLVPAINIDTTRPVITALSVSTPADATGAFHKDAATVTFGATDTNGSGFASPVADFSHSTVGEGSALLVNSATNGAIVDKAGNAAFDINAGPYKVDASNPLVSAGISASSARAYTDATGTDWYKDSVDLSFTASDPNLADLTPGSGLATAATGTVNKTTSGSYSTTTSDKVGHDTTSNVVSYMVDAQAPTVTATCPTAAITKGSAATASWTASDEQNGSGLAGAGTGTVPLDSTTVGLNTATVPAARVTDNVGHSSDAATCTYSVVYRWTGFFQPIDTVGGNGKDSTVSNNTIYNKVKAGSSIPAKFALGGNMGLSVMAFGFPKAAPVTCLAAGVYDTLEETSSSLTSVLKYDATVNAPIGQYTYSWKTATSYAGTCQRLQVKLVDGNSYYAFFNFTK